jgi:hypothetical protein
MPKTQLQKLEEIGFGNPLFKLESNKIAASIKNVSRIKNSFF